MCSMYFSFLFIEILHKIFCLVSQIVFYAFYSDYDFIPKLTAIFVSKKITDIQINEIILKFHC